MSTPERNAVEAEAVEAQAMAKEKSDNRAMVIVSIVIVAFIAGIMGLNVMFSDGGSGETPAETPSVTAPAPETPPAAPAPQTPAQ